MKTKATSIVLASDRVYTRMSNGNLVRVSPKRLEDPKAFVDRLRAR